MSNQMPTDIVQDIGVMPVTIVANTHTGETGTLMNLLPGKGWKMIINLTHLPLITIFKITLNNTLY